MVIVPKYRNICATHPCKNINCKYKLYRLLQHIAMEQRDNLDFVDHVHPCVIFRNRDQHTGELLETVC